MAVVRRSNRDIVGMPVPASLPAHISAAHLELIPTPKAFLQYEHLPPASTVSVTASPVRDLQATLDMSAELLDLGHTAIPHLAARMVEGPQHVTAIARWLADHGVGEVFVIGGDAAEPHGPYHDATALLRALLEVTDLRRVGVGGYPDGHASIPADRLREALIDKQQLLDDAGIAGWISTQMCFDAAAITSWVGDRRSAGLHLPIHLGVPGVIDSAKLLTMGMKLGVGASLRYLRKNRAVVGRLAAPGGYDPMALLVPMAGSFHPLGIDALHMFTFNQVANTVAWQATVAAASARS